MSFDKIAKNYIPKRNILEGEIDDLLTSIENDEHFDSYCYHNIESDIKGLLDDLK